MNLFDAFIYTLVDFAIQFPKYFLEALIAACLCYLLVSGYSFIKKVYHNYLCMKCLNFCEKNINVLFLNIFEIILVNYPDLESKNYNEFKGTITFFHPKTHLAFRRYFVKLNFDLSQKEDYQKFMDSLIFYIYDNTNPEKAYSDTIFSTGKDTEFKKYLFGLSNSQLKEKLEQIKTYVYLFKICCIVKGEYKNKKQLQVMHRNINFSGTYLNINEEEAGFESVSLISSDK